MGTLIGRVGMVVKGAWDSSVAYDTMDVVTYSNSTYIAKQALPAGTLPTNTTYWQLALDASQLQPKVPGMGLSENNYTDAAKGIVDSTPTNLGTKADKVVPVVAGNIATLNASGNLEDGGVALNINLPADGQQMRYNGTSGKWENYGDPLKPISIGAESDLNTIKPNFGIYTWGTMPTNAPTSYATMIVYGGGWYGTHQVVTNAFGIIYLRTWLPETNSWSAWKTVTLV